MLENLAQNEKIGGKERSGFKVFLQIDVKI